MVISFNDHSRCGVVCLSDGKNPQRYVLIGADGYFLSQTQSDFFAVLAVTLNVEPDKCTIQLADVNLPDLDII